MAYSRIERQLWNDEKVRRMGRDTRELYWYLLTSPHMDGPGGRLGCYVLDPMYAAADISTPDYRWSPEKVEEELERLDHEFGRIVWDPETRLVLILRYWKYNPVANPNLARAAAQDYAELPFSETVSKRLLECCQTYLKPFTERLEPWGKIIEDAIRSRLDNELQSRNINRSRNGFVNGSANGSRNGSGNRMPNQEQEQEQEHEHIPAVVEASRPNPTHAPARARGAEPPPAAPAAAAATTADSSLDQPKEHADYLEAMRRLVDEAASELPTRAERRRLRAELELIVTGDDVAAWRDARGETVPWEDRPRLLKLALQRWKLDRDQYPKPRSALLYVVAQQYDPHHASISPKAEAEHYAKHRDGAARRMGSEPIPAGGLVGIDPPRRDDIRPEDRRAQDWARDNPEKFQEFIREAAERESLQLDNMLHRIRATGLALQRVREEVLAS